MMDTIKLLIFDFDDTIIHTGINFRQLKQEVVNRVIDAGHDDLIEKINPLTIANILEAIKKKEGPSSSLYTELMETVTYFESEAVKTAEMNPSYSRLLGNLKSRFKVALLTNNSKQAVDILLAKFGIAESFHLVLAREDVPVLKPDPSGLIKVLDFFKIDKKNAMFIGDSYVDMLAGKAAGIKFVGVGKRWNEQDKDYKDQAGHIINDLNDLLPLLQN
ncbi:MAG: HAD family hydrolase [Candidatus Hodarchaeales archaeon]